MPLLGQLVPLLRVVGFHVFDFRVKPLELVSRFSDNHPTCMKGYSLEVGKLTNPPSISMPVVSAFLLRIGPQSTVPG